MGSVPIPPDYTSLTRRISSLERELELLRARRIPASSLPPELLSAPVGAEFAREIVGGWALSGLTDLVTVTLTVPEGFEKGTFLVRAMAFATNSFAGSNEMWIRPDMTAPTVEGGEGASDTAGVGGIFLVYASYEFYEEGLTGGDTVTFDLRSHVDSAIAAHVDNFARMSVITLWTR